MVRSSGIGSKKQGGFSDPYLGSYTNRRANRLFARSPDEMDQEDMPSQRKRVPVACNRCRRRKIRCSGDDGKGNPCRGCASSKTNERCLFLRVNAQEFDTSLRDEFGYDLVACRQYQTANLQALVSSPMSQGMMQYPGLVPTDPVSGSLVQRNSAPCLYNGRTVYGTNGQWTPPYTADGSPVSPSYATVSSSASTDAYPMGMYHGRQNMQHPSIYTDNATPYHYDTGDFNGASQQQALVRRSPSASPDRDAFSFQTVANALQTTTGVPSAPQLFRPGPMHMAAPVYNTRTPPSTPGSLSPSSSINEAHSEYHGYGSQGCSTATMYQAQQTTEAVHQMPMMQEHYAQHSPAGPPASLRQNYFQTLGPVRDTSFRQSYGIPPRNSRSPTAPAVVPSQQYMLGSQRMAYTGPNDNDADAEGEEVRFKHSP